MAVSKRLRFEVLRRDGFACRYCGAKAPDVQLHVDHVIPESLGGRTESTNLVAACIDCNSGKASTHPDDQVVADVEGAAAEWRAAMELAVEEHATTRRRAAIGVRVFDEEIWSKWHYTEGSIAGQPIERPDGWKQSVERFLDEGLTLPDLEELVEVAMTTSNRDPWRYFCGCAWRRLDAIRDRAAELLD